VSVKIVYHPLTVDVTLTLVRGPVEFQCYYEGRVHDNLATSGAARERVVEKLDLMIEFKMPHMTVAGDIEAWASFQTFALAGGAFKFYPDDSLADYYNCVAEDTGWNPQRNAPRKYGAAGKFRILADAQEPADPSVVLRRFYGIAN
jgi:hypothetical protein